MPFFWLACLVVYWWGRRYCGGAGAVVAVFLFTLLPPILAHAGLATTEMALTAFVGAAFLAGLAWAEQPATGRAVVFGLAVSGGILSKFSFLAFFPVSAFLALAVSYGSRRPLRVTWAGYRFSVGRPDAASMVLPAPELFQGVQAVAQHNREGHAGYLLGERSKTGFLLFFPVALRVKTPIPFRFGASSALSHPDYLPYFNELAGDRPENILVDSDLDWGQDMNRLGERLRRAGAEWVMFTQFALADLQKERGFPMVLRSHVPSPSPGWNAVSVSVWKRSRMQLYETLPEVTPRPDKFTPQERVGKSILLWYFPPGNSRPAALGR